MGGGLVHRHNLEGQTRRLTGNHSDQSRPRHPQGAGAFFVLGCSTIAPLRGTRYHHVTSGKIWEMRRFVIAAFFVAVVFGLLVLILQP